MTRTIASPRFVLPLLVVTLANSQLTKAQEPAPPPTATTEQIRQAVQNAIPYVEGESANWMSVRVCAACHHLGMPMWAAAEAERNGYPINKKFQSEITEKLLGSRENLLASKIFPIPGDTSDTRPQARGLNMGLPFMAVAAYAQAGLTDAQKQTLKLVAEEIVIKQQPDGSWEWFPGLRRPPINESNVTDAVWIIMALTADTGTDVPDAQRIALSRAVGWLEAAKPADLHQDKALKLLLGIRMGKPRAELQPTIDELLTLQRADGGWSQTVPEPRSDAFATGQTLYVLSLAGFTADRPAIKRAIDLLVATQLPDGSWPMISRSSPDGSPGSSKLLTPINTAAASWAILGLSRLVPAAPTAPAQAAAGSAVAPD